MAEERFRQRKYGKQPRHHIYYHCSRQKDFNCEEPYVSEKKLEESLLRFINFMYIAHPREIKLNKEIQTEMENYRKTREDILLQQNIDPRSQVWDIRDYTKHILSNGNSKKKRDLFTLFDYQFYLQHRTITTLRAH